MIPEQPEEVIEGVLQSTQPIYSRQSHSPSPRGTGSNPSQVYWDQLPDPSPFYNDHPESAQQNRPAPLKPIPNLSISTSSRASSGDGSTVLITPLTPPSGNLDRKRTYEKTGIQSETPPAKRMKSAPPTKLNTPRSPKTPKTPGSAIKPKLSSSAGTAPDPIILKYPELRALNPVIIAHSDEYQQLLKSKGICFGVQMEIARLISLDKIGWHQIQVPSIKQLEGDNRTTAPLVEEVLLSREMSSTYKKNFADEITAKTPWGELDLEEADIKDSNLKNRRSMGCNTDENWYGGKVDICAKLKVDQNGNYKIVVDQPRLGSSTRFKRQWGSKAFLFIKIPLYIRNKSDNRLLDFFRRPFVLMGRVYRAFMLSDATVHLFAAADNFLFESPDGLSDVNRFWAFMNFHNPLSLNCNQGSAKYGSRFKLSASNSVPGVRIALEDVINIEDVVAEGYNLEPGAKLPAEYDMTDGCGFINREGMKRIRAYLQLDHIPSAIQCRILGAKGMLLIKEDEDPQYDPTLPRVYLRPSQIKIRFDHKFLKDKYTPIVDVLRYSCHKISVNLAPDTLVNLAHNGVDHSVFVSIMKEGLKTAIESLTNYGDRTSLLLLWRAVQKAGNVISQRIARELGGASRAKGFGDRHDDEPDDDDDGEGEEEGEETTYFGKSTAWWMDMVSGCPSSLEETVMTMLDSGFNPNDNEILFSKLEKVIITVINRYVSKYKLEVPMSTSAFMVPDPDGVLEHDEIFFQSSEPFVAADGCEDTFLKGDVLVRVCSITDYIWRTHLPNQVTRHPCRLPTDIQKVKAVFRATLCPYRDVIVFSIKGKRSPASMLGGGDYDGDTAQIIWQPEIVKPFRNADPLYATAPKEIERDTRKEDRPLRSFIDRKLNPEQCVKELTPYLLSGLKDTSLVGTYSNWHIMSTYRYGYSDPRTIRLAWMFCTILDGSKTGITVTKEVFAADKKEWNWRRMPVWKEDSESRQKKGPGNDTPTVHNAGELVREGLVKSKKFIMDILNKTGKDEASKCTSQLRERADTIRGFYDEDLTCAWKELIAMADRQSTSGFPYLKDIIVPGLQKHVEKLRSRHRLTTQKLTHKPIQDRQDILRGFSLEFIKYVNNPPAECRLHDYLTREAALTAIASYAYIHDYDKNHHRSTRFPYDVAMRELCAIKAKASGHSKTVSGLFYNHMNVRAPNTLSWPS